MDGDDVLVGLTEHDCIRLSPEGAVRAVTRDSMGALMQGVPSWRLYDGVRSLQLIPIRYVTAKPTQCTSSLRRNATDRFNAPK